MGSWQGIGIQNHNPRVGSSSLSSATNILKENDRLPELVPWPPIGMDRHGARITRFLPKAAFEAGVLSFRTIERCASLTAGRPVGLVFD